MIILAIDTATDAVSVALHDGDGVIATSESRSERQHAELLTPMIDFVCKQANLTLHDVGAVAVDVGPGWHCVGAGNSARARAADGGHHQP